MIVAMLLASQALASTPDLGKAAGQCRTNENGPAFLVEVAGLKDRRGKLKLELYPATEDDFLADDNILLNAGKAFARVEVDTPRTGAVELCIRAPAPGVYALSLLHDRNGDRKFNLSGDGVGFSDNPKLGWSKPSAASVRILAGTRPVRTVIRLNYRKGLFSIGPLKD
jgi:uncharacterized protein (DUF2141 family)